MKEASLENEFIIVLVKNLAALLSLSSGIKRPRSLSIVFALKQGSCVPSMYSTKVNITSEYCLIISENSIDISYLTAK